MNEQVLQGVGPWGPLVGGPGGTSPGPNRKTRSSHTKSHTGCLTCRSRRVKCDETQPICDKCSFRRIQCVYPSEQDLMAGASKSSHQAVAPKGPHIDLSLEESPLSSGPVMRRPESQTLANAQALPSVESPAQRKRNHGDQPNSGSESGLHFLWAGQGARAEPSNPGAHQTQEPIKPRSPSNPGAHQTQQMQFGEPISGIALEGLNLFSNFTARTYATLSLLEGKQQVWKNAVIQLSSCSSCLMYMLLAVSAMYEAHLEKASLARGGGAGRHHLQGRIALHRDPSVPIQLPDPTYMRIRSLQLNEQHFQVPDSHRHASQYLPYLGSKRVTILVGNSPDCPTIQ